MPGRHLLAISVSVFMLICPCAMGSAISKDKENWGANAEGKHTINKLLVASKGSTSLPLYKLDPILKSVVLEQVGEKGE